MPPFPEQYAGRRHAKLNEMLADAVKNTAKMPRDPVAKVSVFDIERGVPIPAIKQHNRRESKYPFARLQVGESFLAPGVKIENLSGSATNAAKKLGFKFTCRATKDGVRCWRVE